MVVKTALARQVQGITLASNTDSNHWVMMDGPAEFGGSNAGTRPKELMVLALGGCTASDACRARWIRDSHRVPARTCHA
jgi:putative redox protein